MEEKKEEEIKSNDTERQVVVFKLADEEFGVSIDEVREILKMDFITRVPNTESHIVGVLNLRGKILVIVNLAKKLSLKEKEADKNTRILIVESEEESAGVIVDSATEVMKIPESCIEPAPSVITQKINAEYIESVGIVDERLIIMLDLKKLLFTYNKDKE